MNSYDELERHEFRPTADENAGALAGLVLMIIIGLAGGWQFVIAGLGFIVGWMIPIRNINAHAKVSLQLATGWSVFFFLMFMMFGPDRYHDDFFYRLFPEALIAYVVSVPLGLVACIKRKQMWARAKKLCSQASSWCRKKGDRDGHT